MAKRIVNKAERNAERYDAKETGYQLYEGSLKGNKFDRLMPLIVSEQNIILAYRNICKNNGSKTPGTDGKTITEIQSLPIETVIKTVRNKLNFYQPKKVRRVEIPKDNGKTRPLGIPSIWDRLIQQCILQILEPICEAKFHERNNGFRPYRSTQNAIAQCYKMAQLQNLHFVVDVDIVGFFDNIDHNKLIRQLWGLGIYKDAADTIVGNCDSTLFLGGKEKSTLKEISELLGKETIDLYNQSENRGSQVSHGLSYQKLGKELMTQDELAVMDGGKCIFMLRGVRPFLSDKYDLTRHPNYRYTADADPKNVFDMERYMKKQRAVVKPTDTFDVYEIDATT